MAFLPSFPTVQACLVSDSYNKHLGRKKNTIRASKKMQIKINTTVRAPTGRVVGNRDRPTTTTLVALSKKPQRLRWTGAHSKVVVVQRHTYRQSKTPTATPALPSHCKRKEDAREICLHFSCHDNNIGCVVGPMSVQTLYTCSRQDAFVESNGHALKCS